MATPTWLTPMRALISKFNSSHAPERLTDSALFNTWAQRAVAHIPTSTSNVAARSSELLRRAPERIRHRTPPRKRSGAVVPTR